MSIDQQAVYWLCLCIRLFQSFPIDEEAAAHLRLLTVFVFCLSQPSPVSEEEAVDLRLC